MANIEYKPVWSEDGQTLSNVLVKDKLETYNVVTEWYDGTPIDDSKLDSDLVYVKYEGKYLVRNFEYGQVLQKDTMQEMRDLSSYEILLLKMGVYKHVQLNGYYEKGDTPAPINYYLSNTSKEDNKGNIIEIEDVKLECSFKNSVIDMKYFGVKGDSVQDDSEYFQNAIDFARNCILLIPKGVYKITKRLNLPENWQVVLEGEGRRSRRGVDFSSGDGIVKIRWEGDPSEGSVFYYDGGTSFDGVIKNIYIKNETGVKDVDGIVFNYNFVNGFMENVAINGFRHGLYLKRNFYYTEFIRCSFYSNDVGIMASPEGSTGTALSNGAKFESCQISRNRIGFMGVALGEIINFDNCYTEYNEEFAFDLSSCKVVNINGGYIEFNGEKEDLNRNNKGIFRISTSNKGLRNPSPTVINVYNNFIFGRGSQSLFSIFSSEKLSLNFKGNMVYGSQFESSRFLFYPVIGNASNTGITMGGNNYFNENIDNTNLEFSNVNSNSFGYINVIKDHFVEKLFPTLLYKSVMNEEVTAFDAVGNSLDKNTEKTIDFPRLSSANATVSFFGRTNTSGNKFVQIYKGDGSNTVSMRLSSDGHVLLNEIRIGAEGRKISHGSAPPTHSAQAGSVYLKTDGTDKGIWEKVDSGTDGWRKVFSNKVAQTAEVTTSDATDDQETQNLVNELKSKVNELLGKMRDAGILEP